MNKKYDLDEIDKKIYMYFKRGYKTIDMVRKLEISETEIKSRTRKMIAKGIDISEISDV